MSKELRSQYLPDQVSPPGETLLETLEALGMSQAELALRTGKSKKNINEIIQGKAPIATDTALQLERVLGIPASFWNNRERAYRESLAQKQEKENLRSRVDWLNKFPIRIMADFGWIKKVPDRVRQLIEILNFFGVASIGQWQEVWSNSLSIFEDFPDRVGSSYFRQSSRFASNPWAVAAWLRRGEIEGLNIKCAPFDSLRFRDALSQIRSLTLEPPEVFKPEVERLCAAAGVAVVFIPELPKVRAWGAARWLSPHKALLQLSLRYKTDDHLWFSFYHESGHILLHPRRAFFIDRDLREADDNLMENQANKFAEQMLIPAPLYRQFIKKHDFSRLSVMDFAETLNIAPGIVVGRLQHEGRLPFSSLNDLKQGFAWDNAPERNGDSRHG